MTTWKNSGTDAGASSSGKKQHQSNNKEKREPAPLVDNSRSMILLGLQPYNLCRAVEEKTTNVGDNPEDRSGDEALT